MQHQADISETVFFRQYPEILETLLKDHTTQQNIFWATDSYAGLGQGFQYLDLITTAHIIGEHGMVIRPRALKTRGEQIGRTKDMAEVFTPSWVCNAQNNLVDDAWFGHKGSFNIEDDTSKSWKATRTPVAFPEGKTWKDYVRSTRMEITCGEAPYLVS